jgi:hypothetical protein
MEPFYMGNQPGAWPLATNDIDWVLRLSETPEAKVVSRMMQWPLTNAGKKVEFKVSVYLRSLIPLQAYLS